jgi:hypothetical protein
LLEGDPDIDDQVRSALLSFLTQRSATDARPLELEPDAVMTDAEADERQDSPSGFSFVSSKSTFDYPDPGETPGRPYYSK